MNGSSNKRTIEAKLKFTADEKSASDVQKTVDNLRSTLERSSKSLTSLDEIGMTMMKVGTGMNVAGNALIAAMVAGSQKYISTMGMADEHSARWLLNSQRIEQSQVRLGRTMTEALNPGFEMMADAAERVARIADQNPWIAKTAAGAGALLSGAGALTGVLGFGMKSVSALSDMSAMGGFVGTAAKGTMALGQVTLVATSVIIGAEIGAAIGNAIGEKIYGDDYKQQTIGDAVMTNIKGYQLPGMYAALGLKNAGIISDDQAKAFSEAISSLNQWVGGIVGATDATVPGLKPSATSTPEDMPLINAGVVETFRSYLQQMEQAEENYEIQRADIIKQFGQQRVQMEEQYSTQVSRSNRNFRMQMAYSEQDWGISRSRSLRDFNLAESQTEKSYYESRSNLSKNYHESIRKAEEDHQKSMSRLLEDHNDRMEDLNARRDALGMKKERDAYEKSRSRSEEDFGSSVSRSSKEYAQQLKEMESSFKEQRALRREAFDRQRQDQEEDYNRQRARQLEQHKIQMSDAAEDHARQMEMLQQNQDDTLRRLKEGYDRQAKLMQESLIDRIRALDPIVLGDYQEYTKYLQGISKQFQDWMSSQTSFVPESSTSKTPSQRRQFGGYAATPGSYHLAEDGKKEYVLDNQSVREAESIIGGPLTQAAIVGKMSGGSSSKSISVQQVLEFHGSFSDAERAWLSSNMATLARDATLSTVRKLVQ